MGKKDTDIHKPDGWVFKGEKIGHANEQSRIRKRDGIFLPGEEIGYVDGEGKIRRPDFLIFQGEEVGQVRGDKVHDKDWFIFSGEEWGYVDGDGNIRQKDCFIFQGRIIGKLRGKNKAAALGYFALRFKEMEDRFKELEQAVRNAENKTPYIGKVRHMLSYVPEANALGDFDGLINRIKNLEREILNQFDDNRRRKEDIARQAESISRSTNWKADAENLKKLQEKWKEIRSAGKDYEEALWQRFRSAQDEFYRRRSEHFENEKQQNSSERKTVVAKKVFALLPNIYLTLTIQGRPFNVSKHCNQIGRPLAQCLRNILRLCGKDFGVPAIRYSKTPIKSVSARPLTGKRKTEKGWITSEAKNVYAPPLNLSVVQMTRNRQ